MKNALVLSPFATSPLDAGQRRRAKQVTALLKDLGYRVCFLFYSFEGDWYYGYDPAALDEMIRDWDEVIHFPANVRTGLPPTSGQFHNLDEWWCDDLGSYLKNLLRRRSFDLFVVHNVWLSKAFEYCPPRTTKILESHDLFWLRNRYYETGVVSPEFFVINKEEELKGLGRADIVCTIQEAEFDVLLRESPNFSVVNLPYVSPDQSRISWSRRDYLHDNKVTFGIIGSDHTFNINGTNLLTSALRRHIGNSFAPVEILVAGRLAEKIDNNISVRKVGYVENEESFYDQVDFVLAPIFAGTGFKVKVADAICRGVPILSSTHAAQGTTLPPEFIFDDADGMAYRICEIACIRPSIAGFGDAIATAFEQLSGDVDSARDALADLILGSKKLVVFDLRRCEKWSGFAKLLAWYSYSQRYLCDCSVWFLIDANLNLVRLGFYGGATIIDENGSDIDRLNLIRNGVVVELGLSSDLFGDWISLKDGQCFVSSSNKAVPLPENYFWSYGIDKLFKPALRALAKFDLVETFVFRDASFDEAVAHHYRESTSISVEEDSYYEVLSYLMCSSRANITIVCLSQASSPKFEFLIDVAVQRGWELLGFVGGALLAPSSSHYFRREVGSCASFKLNLVRGLFDVATQ